MKIIDPDDPSSWPMPAQEPPQRQAQVLRFGGVTKLDLQPELVLQGALDEGLKCAVVLGYAADGCEYFASSMADGADVLWLLERLKLKLLSMGRDDAQERFT